MKIEDYTTEQLKGKLETVTKGDYAIFNKDEINYELNRRQAFESKRNYIYEGLYEATSGHDGWFEITKEVYDDFIAKESYLMCKGVRLSTIQNNK